MANELSEAEVELPGVGPGDESARRCVVVFGSGGCTDTSISRSGRDQRSAIKRACSFLLLQTLVYPSAISPRPPQTIQILAMASIKERTYIMVKVGFLSIADSSTRR